MNLQLTWKKKLRLKRFKAKGGNEKLFSILNGKQYSDIKKAKFSNHIIVNEKNLNILKKNLLGIIELYVWSFFRYRDNRLIF